MEWEGGLGYGSFIYSRRRNNNLIDSYGSNLLGFGWLNPMLLIFSLTKKSMFSQGGGVVMLFFPDRLIRSSHM